MGGVREINRTRARVEVGNRGTAAMAVVLMRCLFCWLGHSGWWNDWLFCDIIKLGCDQVTCGVQARTLGEFSSRLGLVTCEALNLGRIPDILKQMNILSVSSYHP